MPAHCNACSVPRDPGRHPDPCRRSRSPLGAPALQPLAGWSSRCPQERAAVYSDRSNHPERCSSASAMPRGSPMATAAPHTRRATARAGLDRSPWAATPHSSLQERGREWPSPSSAEWRPRRSTRAQSSASLAVVVGTLKSRSGHSARVTAYPRMAHFSQSRSAVCKEADHGPEAKPVAVPASAPARSGAGRQLGSPAGGKHARPP